MNILRTHHTGIGLPTAHSMDHVIPALFRLGAELVSVSQDNRKAFLRLQPGDPILQEFYVADLDHEIEVHVDFQVTKLDEVIKEYGAENLKTYDLPNMLFYTVPMGGGFQIAFSVRK